MENNLDINITRDPKSEDVSTEQDQTLLAFNRELVELTQKYGYEAFLISVTDQIQYKEGMLVSSAIGTLDPDIAFSMAADSFRVVKNLVSYLKTKQDLPN